MVDRFKRKREIYHVYFLRWFQCISLRLDSYYSTRINTCTIWIFSFALKLSFLYKNHFLSSFLPRSWYSQFWNYKYFTTWTSHFLSPSFKLYTRTSNSKFKMDLTNTCEVDTRISCQHNFIKRYTYVSFIEHSSFRLLLVHPIFSPRLLLCSPKLFAVWLVFFPMLRLMIPTAVKFQSITTRTA